MPDIEQFLESVSLFEALTATDRKGLAALAMQHEWNAEDVIYREGEPGDSLYVIIDGAVELQARIAEGVDRTLVTIRTGSGFGLLEAIDPQSRAVTAKALTATTTLEFDRTALSDFIEQEPASRVNLLHALSTGLARQSRVAIDLLRQNMAWTLEASGAAALNLHQLITDRVRVRIDLVNGQQVQGTLLKVEPSSAGHELLVRDDDDVHQLVPYHAVARILFAAADVESAADVMPDLT